MSCESNKEFIGVLELAHPEQLTGLSSQLCIRGAILAA